MWETIKDSTCVLITSIFIIKSGDRRPVRQLNHLLLVILFVFGLFLFARFMNYGQIPDNRLDWRDITYPRLMVLQQAIREGVFPLHVDQVDGIKGVTNRYFSVPDLILSPQVLFLKWYSVGSFILIQTLLFYSIGFCGLLVFKHRFHLSLMSFLPLFLLFNFNGHIITHLTVGHLTWAGYFLLPFWMLLVMDVVQNKSMGWIWVGKFSILQALIFLQGGYHQFVWILFFMGFLCLGRLEKCKWIFLGMVFAILINTYRILPGALLQKALSMKFLAGFPTVGDLLHSFSETKILKNAYLLPNKVDVTIWEFNMYSSVIGCLFLLLGMLYLYRHRSDSYFHLVLPCAAIGLLSIGNLYKPFFDSGIPLFSGERISARFLILPVVVLLFLAAMQLQKQFENTSSPNFQYATAGILTLLLANDLTQYLGKWGITSLIQLATPELCLELPVLGFVDDPVYISFLIFGAVISIISLVFLLIKGINERKYLQVVQD